MATYYDYVYDSSEVVEPIEAIDGPPGVGQPGEPGYEILTGEQYPIIVNPDGVGFVIDDANVTGLDVQNELPAPLFQVVPGTEPVEPPFVNPSLTTDPELIDTWYSRVYTVEEVNLDAPPGVEPDPTETVSGYGFPVLANPDGVGYVIDVTRVTGFDLSLREPSTLFEKINPEPETVAPFNVSYILTPEKLVEISDVFEPGFIDPEQSTPLIEWVLNVLVIPFEIPAEYVGVLENINIGNTIKQVQAPLLLDDIIEFNMGDITISNFQGNSLDYYENVYNLFLPFINDVIEIDASLIVNETINVKIILDAYTGDVTLNVYNSGVNPILSRKLELGREIPFKVLADSPLNYNNGFKGIYNGITRAYIRRERPELNESEFNNLVLLDGVLTNETGYIQVENVNLNVNASFEEIEGIKNLLNQGVYING